MLGTCSIGTNGNGEKYVARSDKSSSGNIWMPLTSTLIEGLILKAVAGKTIIGGKGNYLPGTTAADYPSGYTYRGKDRYYKLHSIGEGNHCTLEDVTDQYEKSRASLESSRVSTATTYKLSQQHFGIKDDSNIIFPYMLIGELIRDHVINKFGGNTEDAKIQNLWIPAGRPVNLDESDNIVVPFEYGDTWYSRYDCLKTYPFTQEDENQVVEIGSFMCETRVNIDGRYDRNRGQLSNLNITPQNFNLLNEVYSQKDNFFNYRILDEDYYK